MVQCLAINRSDHGQNIQNRRSRQLEFGSRQGARQDCPRPHQDVTYKGYVHHASPDEPQYEIKSDKTAHIALHKGRALRHLAR
jgi:hypothetical protein